VNALEVLLPAAGLNLDRRDVEWFYHTLKQRRFDQAVGPLTLSHSIPERCVISVQIESVCWARAATSRAAATAVVYWCTI